MWQAFNLPFTQGLEGFLVVGVVLAWLRANHRLALVPAARAGIAVSILAIPAAAQLFSESDNQALWQGALGVTAAAGVARLVVYVRRHGREEKTDLPAAGGRASAIGLFLLVVLLITRQSLELALLMTTLLFQMYSDTAVIGIVTAGVVLSVAVAWLWARFAHRVERSRLLVATFAFLGILFVQLSMSGIYRLTEAGVLPYNELVYGVTEPLGPEGRWAPILSYALFLVPGACLLLGPAATGPGTRA